MGLTFTKLFARLFSKREMRILMVRGSSKGEGEKAFLSRRKRRKTIDGRWKKKSSPTVRGEREMPHRPVRLPLLFRRFLALARRPVHERDLRGGLRVRGTGKKLQEGVPERGISKLTRTRSVAPLSVGR